MANEKNFNSSTISFGSDQAPLRSIRHTASGAAIPISGAADTLKLYDAGIPDLEVTFDIVGATTIAVGDTNAIAIAWGGGSDSPDGSDAGTWVCTNVETGGDEDGEITSSITCKPATAPV